MSMCRTLLANRWLNKTQLVLHRAIALTFFRIISALFKKKKNKTTVTVLGVVETI